MGGNIPGGNFPGVNFPRGNFPGTVNSNCNTAITTILFKGALSGLKQFSPIESPLKMMGNALCFTWKALFILKDIWIFVLTFCYKHYDLVRNNRLISNLWHWSIYEEN